MACEEPGRPHAESRLDLVKALCPIGGFLIAVKGMRPPSRQRFEQSTHDVYLYGFGKILFI